MSARGLHHRRPDPSDELFDAACDLLQAARALQDAAAAGDTRFALPATLGAIEAVLHTLDDGTGLLTAQFAGASAEHQALRRLGVALGDAARACEQARAQLAAPSVERLRARLRAPARPPDRASPAG
ncbi:hypothetical protein PAI11_32770 [Patulibacter medicamentivorans]|uniref:Uncharacterized protein n=1 Tax=Patulibacter medicamentivorans TaxID=1097667 RepID=H0E8W3_9ACTN|nr:hypothetical protein [Patulibacter medicamentivorans]EHN09863.1 hypothetical protein PAI11_32770 [Patulibacter medicamentivorans]